MLLSYDVFMALVVFAFVTSITPGPNNLMLLASGVNFGFRRTIPHMLGIGIGFLSLLLGVGYGLGAVLETAPALYVGLKFAGGAYMLYLAYKIATSTSVGRVDDESAQPMSFMQAWLFQWVNPKAWVMAVTAMASYTVHDAYSLSVLLIGVVFAVINVPSVSSWAAFGSLLRQWLEDPVRLKWFNLTMAALLVVSLWPMLK
ncbi:LysE family translocator [Pseudochrobactrum algeriensis]|uniref:Threonine/homoserine/homoserine lactone efflux protein n=1 Tax=Pseudochrobactrum saccharolyticum TaxID=354352 RepID=A0A7W8EQQ2_9HYPH|nr:MULTISPECIES: LysE family translocator [Pseudochrobactrum]MBX8784322.1 LysE family translocator [Ochrobactrum sp. GRS2]MBX8811702.1 LysE family translocator [Ochrobactrum sp. MR34]KAB0537725.1 LysE family translocator [Pseudochrobactrum saccharolyticum]MBB5091888.1 threonine/homoserine/homoserine lactone efflux protein [Pseudochrobactrum saccharolyticum]MDP8250268.1 LysE family translocator [Pseudochrobactrum saccharolyticum]